MIILYTLAISPILGVADNTKKTTKQWDYTQFF